MGGTTYDRDVYSVSSSSSTNYSSYYNDTLSSKRSVEHELVPVNRKNGLLTQAPSTIVIMLDVTGSMGDDAKIIYDKLPLFWHELVKKEYLDCPEICFVAIGDANSDMAPLQVCDFAHGSELDKWIKKIYLEGNGGGNQKESYELAAYWFDRYCTKASDKENSFMFFTGDEGFYEKVEAEYIREYCWSTYKKGSVKSRDVFSRLQQQWNVFRLHRKYYSSSDNSRIVKQWKETLGNENVIELENPKAIVDIILGIISVFSKSRTVDEYLVDLKDRKQSKSRIKEVKNILIPLAESNQLIKIDDKSLATQTIQRKMGSKRL